MDTLLKLSKKPAISVIIPSYNEEKLLPECLTSLTKQTFTDFEVIVVDNNCRDKTPEIAKRFGARVVKEKKQGMIAARQKGFAVAKGTIIARIDADAQANSDWLSVIHKTFEKYPEVVGITGNFTSPSRQLAIGYGIWSFALINILGKGITGHYYLVGSNSAFRKKALSQITPHWDERLNEDFDLSCHLADIGPLLYVPEMRVTLSLRKVRQHPLKGIMTYGFDYPRRYFRTLHTHYPYLRKTRLRSLSFFQPKKKKQENRTIRDH